MVAISAKDIHVNLSKAVANPGSLYGTDLVTPWVQYEKLKDGHVNCKYTFSLDVEKDLKDDLLNMKIDFPQGVKYFVTAFDGIQGFVMDDEQVPALLEHESYVECLIPVKKGGNGFIEIQLTIPKNYIGSDVPIKVNFDNYKKKGVNVVGAVVVGLVSIPIGIGVATYSYFKNRETQTAQIEEKFADIKKKYKMTPLPASMKRFRIQVR